jgi:hypothetical protein
MLALVGAVTLGCAACQHDAASAPVSGTSSDSANPTGELNDIQSTLDSIDSDIAGDGSP